MAIGNQPPVNSVPSNQTIIGNATLVFSSGNGNQISVADTDSSGNPEQIALSVGSGKLTLSGTAGLTFTAGSNGSAAMTVQGTLANINAALNGLTYTPPSNLTSNSSDTLNLVTNDLGNSGVGGPQTTSSTVNITLNHIDVAPVNTVPTAQTVNDNAILVFNSANSNQISIADSDSNGNPEQVALSVGSGTLTLNGTTGLTFTAGSNGSAAMTVEGTLANINAALNGLTYTPPPNLTSNSSDTLNLVSNDLGNSGVGGPRTASSTVNITLNHIDIAPVNIVPTAQTVDDSATLVFSSANSNQISIADSDSNSNPEQIALSVGSGTLTLNGTTGLTFTVGSNGSAAMTVQGTLANLNAALNGLTYTPPSNLTNNSSDTLNLVANDLGNTGSGGPRTASSTVNITLNHVDLPPVNSVPAGQTTQENVPLVFSAANGNAISIADSDANGKSEQVTLTATNGTLTLSGTSGLTFTGGANGSATITALGTLANLNNALNGLNFTPSANYAGAASLQLVTNDLGNTGIGGSLSTTTVTNITVNAVLPTLTVPPAQQSQNVALVFSSTNGNQIIVGSSGGGAGTLGVMLTATNGTMTLAGTAGLGFTSGNGQGNTAMTFSGAASAINAALNGMIFQTSALNAGLQITVSSSVAGSGSPPTVTAAVPITQVPLIPPPVPTSPNPSPSPNSGPIIPAPVPVSVSPTIEPVTPSPAASSNSLPTSGLAANALITSPRADTRLTTIQLTVSESTPVDFAAARKTPSAIGGPRIIREFVDLYLSKANASWEDLDNIRNQLQSEIQTQTFVIGSALTLSTGLTVGYVMWMLRGGMLLTSLLAQIPAWSLIDPLVILSGTDDDEDETRQEKDESLQTILDASGGESPEGEAVPA
jgi:hypothetical protein